MTTFNQLTTMFQFPDADARKKALAQIHQSIQKEHGKESVTVLDNKRNLDIPNVPTGIMELDLAIGIGGMPLGRIIEIFGPNSAGKTTLALNEIAQTQRRGGLAAFVDAEHALDPKWAKFHGVNLDELLLSQPECGEDALQLVESFVKAGVNIIVIDSAAALVPRSELEKDMGESSMGRQALLMSQAMRKLVGLVSKSKSIVIFLNQMRKNIGGYGNPNCVTPETLIEVEF